MKEDSNMIFMESSFTKKCRTTHTWTQLRHVASGVIQSHIDKCASCVKLYEQVSFHKRTSSFRLCLVKEWKNRVIKKIVFLYVYLARGMVEKKNERI